MQTLCYKFDTSDLLGSLERWEFLIKQYDVMVPKGESLQDKVKIATLIKHLGGNLQDHFV